MSYILKGDGFPPAPAEQGAIWDNGSGEVYIYTGESWTKILGTIDVSIIGGVESCGFVNTQPKKTEEKAPQEPKRIFNFND